MSFRFSPNTSLADLRAAVSYTAEQTSLLCVQTIGTLLPIHTLTIFSHTEDEYVYLKDLLKTLGSSFNENNGPRVTLHEPMAVGNHVITHLRIRKPDPERPQVGCNDFDVEQYAAFKSEYLAKHPENLILIEGPEYEMIEFRH